MSLDSSSASVKSADTGQIDRIDLPMRAFAGGFYGNLQAMYDHLGVRYQVQPFLFSFSRIVPSIQTSLVQNKGDVYFIHSSNNDQIPPTRPENVSFLAYMVEVVYLFIWYGWFTICCFFIAPVTSTGDDICETFEQYVQRIRLPQYFTRNYILPLMCSVATCPHESLLQFPAMDLIDYKRRTHRKRHYVVCNKIREVQAKLAQGLEIQLSTRVVAVKPYDSGIELLWEDVKLGRGSNLTRKTFDRVILAVPPDVVGTIFEPLRRRLALIPTLITESIVHTNETRLPCSRPRAKDPTTQTIHLRTSTEGSARTESVHVQPSGVLVTTCPLIPIHAANIIQSSRFTRVLRTPASRKLVNNIFGAGSSLTGEACKESLLPAWKNGNGGVWLAGGWCWDGLVLLEGCVVSAMRVANALGVEIPWQERVYTESWEREKCFEPKCT